MLIIKEIAQLKLNSGADDLKIGYTRVSTELKHQDISLKRQTEDFKDNGCDLVFIERETGRNSDNRPLYLELINLVKQNKVLEILVTESSRLNRNDAENTYFERLCEIHNTKIIYLNQPELNFDTVSARLLRKEEAIAAEAYSRRLSINIKKGNDRIRKNLKPLSKVATFGYRFTQLRDLEIDWVLNDNSNAIITHQDKYYATGELARFLIESYLEHESQYKAFKLFKDLLSQSEAIATDKRDKYLKRSASWFSRWLSDPVIRGHLVYNKYKYTYQGNKLEKTVRILLPKEQWEIHRGVHPALISRAEAIAIDKIKHNNTNTGWSSSLGKLPSDVPVPLSTLLRCNCCKLSFRCQTTKYKDARYRHYVCVGKKEHRCFNTGISEKKLVKSLIKVIGIKAKELTEILYNARLGKQDVRQLKIEELKKESDELLKLHQITGRPSYLTTYQEILDEIKHINSSLSKDIVLNQDKQKVLQSLQDEDFWRSMDDVELHNYFRAIINVAWIGTEKQVVDLEFSL